MSKIYIIWLAVFWAALSVFGQTVEFAPPSPIGTILDLRPVSGSREFSITETESVLFAWDSGISSGFISWLDANDVEAIRYTTEYPCSLYEISCFLEGYGTIELHIWEDWSGLPNVASGDLCPFIFLTTYGGSGWREINIEAEIGHKVYIPPMTDFQIGRIYRGAEPYIKYASNYVPVCSHVYDADSATWYYIGDEGGAYPYMIRARGIYFDIDTLRQFKNVADSAGLSGGRTVAWGDYDNDGDDDVVCSGTLYRNNGDGTFTDVGISMGGNTSWGDFSGDGLLDAVSITYPLKLWRNNGDGTFTDVADSMGFVDYDEPKNCGGFGDIDGDGWLDLYVSYSEVWGDIPVYYPDHLYKNMAGTLFVEVTDSFAPAVSDDRYSRGIHFCDFDTDGDQDIYISCYRLLPNYFLINDGTGRFTDEAIIRGVAGHEISGYYGHTIGSVWCDFDNDGDFDIIGANLAHPRFIDFSDKSYIFRNNGDGTFTDLFETSGIAYYETHSSPAVGDYDNDGNLDLYFSCVYEGYHSWIYKGNGDGTFTCDNYKSGVWTDNGWGAGWSDYDDDGDLDLLVSGNTGLELYRNDRCPHDNNWIKLRLFCDITTNNYFAYGAQARLYLSDGRIMSRCIQGNTGVTACMDSRTMHFGLGDVTIADSLVILWPGAIRQVIPDLAVDKWVYTIYESGVIDTVSNIEERGNSLPTVPSISAYPNPFNSSVTIEVRGVGAHRDGAQGQIARIEIFDMTGRLVGNLPLTRAESGGDTDCAGMSRSDSVRGPTPLIWTPDESLGSGVYFVRETASCTTVRIVLLR